MQLSNEIFEAFKLLNKFNIYNDRIGIKLIKIKDVNQLLNITLKYLDLKIKLDTLKKELISDKKLNIIEKINQCYKSIDLLNESKFDKVVFTKLKNIKNSSQAEIINVLEINIDEYTFLRFKNVFSKKIFSKKIKSKKTQIKYTPSFEDSWRTNNSVKTIYTNPSRY